MITATSHSVSTSQAARIIGCSQPALCWWVRNGCPYLSGRKLKPFKQGLAYYYRLSDIDQIRDGFQAAASRPDAIIRQGHEFLALKKAGEYAGLPDYTIQDRHNQLTPLFKTFRGVRTAYYSKSQLDRFVAERQTLAARAVDPELIFTCDAEELTGCSRQTLNRLAAKGKLHKEKVRVLNSVDRVCVASAFRKAELASLFVRRPGRGEPIRISSDETYYLRADAAAHFQCSDIVLSYWANQKSRCHEGAALHTRKFFVISPRGRGRPKLLTTWRGEHLALISAGREGVRPESGKGHWAINQRLKARAAALAFLRWLKPRLPLPASEGLVLAMQAGHSRALVYQAKASAGIKTRLTTEGVKPCYYWCLPGQTIPVVADASTPPAPSIGMNAAEVAHAPKGGDGASTLAPKAMHLRVEPVTTVTASRPQWNAHRRELLYNGVVCVRYTKQAPFQETILAAFEETGWPDRMDDPLPPGKLRTTLWLLMVKVKASPIRFSSDGSGKGILWSIRPI